MLRRRKEEGTKREIGKKKGGREVVERGREREEGGRNPSSGHSDSGCKHGLDPAGAVQSPREAPLCGGKDRELVSDMGLSNATD